MSRFSSLLIVCLCAPALSTISSDDAVSLLQVGKADINVRDVKDQVAAPQTVKTRMSEALKDRKVNKSRGPGFDEHGKDTYNWGNEWDQYYNDLATLYPDNYNGKKVYNTLNYGFASMDQPLHECAADVPAGDERITPFNHTSGTNMYAQLASKSSIDFKDARVLEVSSGRGGGAAFLSDCFCPSHMVGLDFSQKQVDMAQTHHSRQGDCPVSFVQGNAMDLPFEDGSYDIIINVEASHTYPSYRKFITEAHRVLRPGGVFLTTDFRTIDDANTDADIIQDVFQDPVNLLDITNNVKQSLTENRMMEPFVESCKQKTQGNTQLSAQGMGNQLESNQQCAAMAGPLVLDEINGGNYNYRMYIMTKQSPSKSAPAQQESLEKRLARLEAANGIAPRAAPAWGEKSGAQATDLDSVKSELKTLEAKLYGSTRKNVQRHGGGLKYAEEDQKANNRFADQDFNKDFNGALQDTARSEQSMGQDSGSDNGEDDDTELTPAEEEEFRLYMERKKGGGMGGGGDDMGAPDMGGDMGGDMGAPQEDQGAPEEGEEGQQLDEEGPPEEDDVDDADDDHDVDGGDDDDDDY